MDRYLIEVAHEPDQLACARAVKLLLETGSHFLTNADFGCNDGDHRAWAIVEAETREEARAILPPLYRYEASIIKLNKFTMDEIDSIISHHKG
jgi:hypothetical protein